MTTHNGILTPAQIETLRAVPTGHAPHAQGTAQDIAQALGVTVAQAANRLGALRRAGLVDRDAQGNGAGVATWARFDSIAPGLEAWQRKALEGAERAAPCRYQAEALDSFGPDCDAAPGGIAPRSDLKAETRDALKARNVQGCLDAARDAQDAGRPLRAALLYREAARFCAGSGRRARYQERAEALEAEAESAFAERGAFGMGTAIPPVDAPAQDLHPLGAIAQANGVRKRAEAAQDWTLRAEAEAAQVAALPQVLAFLDARPVAHGLKVAPRSYVCRVCGAVESFSTNHTGPHYSACGACSWRGGRDDSGRYYSAQEKGRPHVYNGPNPTGQGEENPHARPQVKAEAQDLDARTVARVLEALKAEAQDLEGKAAQAAHNARVWARPGVPQETGDKAAQDAAQAEAEARNARTVANVLEALKAQAEAPQAQAAPVAWRTASDVTMNPERAENWQAMGCKVWPLFHAAQAEALPRLALPSPYVLEGFARLDAESGLALVYLPQNVATPWASYRVDLATGVCVAGDYLPPYDNARALALRAFAERLGDALGARVTAWA